MIRAIVLALVIAIAGCAGTPDQNQEKADQVFGKAKLYLVIGSGTVALYNVACASTALPLAACTKNVTRAVNDILAGAVDAVSAAEKVFADVNSTQDARLAAAKASMTLVAELQKAIDKYGLARAQAG